MLQVVGLRMRTVWQLRRRELGRAMRRESCGRRGKRLCRPWWWSMIWRLGRLRPGRLRDSVRRRRSNFTMSQRVVLEMGFPKIAQVIRVLRLAGPLLGLVRPRSYADPPPLKVQSECRGPGPETIDNLHNTTSCSACAPTRSCYKL
jgi:hypothetical protein